MVPRDHSLRNSLLPLLIRLSLFVALSISLCFYAESIEGVDVYEGSTGLLHEKWNELDGSFVSDLINHDSFPYNPSAITIVPQPSASNNAGDHYGVRLRGYLLAPEDGEYTFWVNGNDSAQLWLSSDETPGGKRLLAQTFYTTGLNVWDKYPQLQKSKPVALKKGHKYYIEILHKENEGNAYFAVGWNFSEEMEQITEDIIIVPDKYFSPYDSSLPEATILRPYQNSVFHAGDTITIEVMAWDPDGEIENITFLLDGQKAGEFYGPRCNYLLRDIPAGEHHVRIIVTDDKMQTVEACLLKFTAIAASSEVSAPEMHGILGEMWLGITGNDVNKQLKKSAKYPHYPTFEKTIDEFAVPPFGTNYGARYRAYLYPPASGYYRFWLTSYGGSELWLSADDRPEKRSLVAHLYSQVTPFAWDNNISQLSEQVYLEAGNRYYIEALHKMDHRRGRDHMAVGWTLPDGTQERPIPAKRLSPYWTDRDAPQIRITSPKNNSRSGVDSNISITHKIESHGEGVEKIEVYSGEMILGVLTQPPYVLKLPELSPGTYSFRSKIYDTQGRTGVSNVSEVQIIDEDTDDDGLSDFEELNTYYTNPDYQDSDHDGLGDGLEIFVVGSDPTWSDAVVNTTIIIKGSEYESASGGLKKDDSLISFTDVRGEVEYQVTLDDADRYLLELDVSGAAKPRPEMPHFFRIYIDDTLLFENELLFEEDQVRQIDVLTPYVAAGKHTIKVMWWSYKKDKYAKIYELRVKQIKVYDRLYNIIFDWINEWREKFQVSGAESYSNVLHNWLNPWLQKRKRNWVIESIDKQASITTAPATSRVSPACIEGQAEYVDLINIAVRGRQGRIKAQKGVGKCWWADIPLSDNETTSYEISFQNGARLIEKQITWEITRLNEIETIMIRKGDSLLLTVFGPGTTEGAGDIQIDGYSYEVSPGKPVLYTFDTAGSYHISGVNFSDDGVNERDLTLEVRVVECVAPEQLVLIKNIYSNAFDSTRKWFWKGLPREASVEYEATDLVEITDNSSCRQFLLNLDPESLNTTYVARLGNCGPVLSSFSVDKVHFGFSPEIEKNIPAIKVFEDGEYAGTYGCVTVASGGGDTWGWGMVSMVLQNGEYIVVGGGGSMGGSWDIDVHGTWDIDCDGDGIGSATDNCPDTCNTLQFDGDADGIGDVCDPDPGCGGCAGPVCEVEC
ncbi:PA14 domain-containing protein [Thermodesulfobacteriota bacterium]